jgi:predicted O-methyltransferase YrrM
MRAAKLGKLLDVEKGLVEKEIALAEGDQMLRGVMARYGELGLKGYCGLNNYAGEALYCSVKILRPEVVLETGVSAGVSSSYLLKAMSDLSFGELHSIDLPGEVESGVLIPQELRKRWRLNVGTSRDLLLPCLERLGKVDVFFHDSDHSYENMRFEMQTAWPFIKRGGLLLADDADSNSAFDETAGRAGTEGIDLLAHAMKGVMKP